MATAQVCVFNSTSKLIDVVDGFVFLWAGDWAPGTYSSGQAVSYNGSSWVSLHDNNSTTPSAGPDWGLVAQGGVIGGPGAYRDRLGRGTSPGTRDQAPQVPRDRLVQATSQDSRDTADIQDTPEGQATLDRLVQETSPVTPGTPVKFWFYRLHGTGKLHRLHRGYRLQRIHRDTGPTGPETSRLTWGILVLVNFTGYTGDTGYSGYTGYTGPTSTGYTGYTGYTGDTRYTGPGSFTGYTGYTGPNTPPYTPVAYGSLGSASSNTGQVAAVNNSSVNTWGGTADGAGGFTVLVWSNGTNWTVIGQ